MKVVPINSLIKNCRAGLKLNRGAWRLNFQPTCDKVETDAKRKEFFDEQNSSTG